MSGRQTLFKYIVPSTISLVAQFLFTIVDGLFLGRGVGTVALGAVNIVFPFIMIFVALITLCSIGGMTNIAIQIGEQDNEAVNNIFMHALCLCVGISVVMGLMAIILTNPLSMMMGANEEFITMSHDYLFWYGLFFLPTGLFIFLCDAVRNDAEPKLVSTATLLSTIFNIFADWLFIFPLNMGVKSAAIASGLSQCLGVFVLLTHFFKKHGILRICRFKLEKSILFEIFLRGIPDCINNFVVPISTLALNIVLSNYIGSIGVNAYALMTYVIGIISSVTTGVATGLQPLFGRSYGAGSREELNYYLKWGIIVSFVNTVAFSCIISIFSSNIYSIFAVNGDVLALAVYATPIISIGFVFQSYTIVTVSYLNSTKRTGRAIIVHVLRGFVVNVVAIFTIPILFGAEAIWWFSAIKEGIIFIITLIIHINADRKLVI